MTMSAEADDLNDPEGEEIDGGSVTVESGPVTIKTSDEATTQNGGIVDADERPVTTREKTKEEKDGDTTRNLAWFLVGIFIFVYLGHIALVTWLSWHGHEKIADKITTLYDKMFPVLTGFVGSAVTYFLTKRDKGS